MNYPPPGSAPPPGNPYGQNWGQEPNYGQPPMGKPPLGGLLIFVALVNIVLSLGGGCVDFSLGTVFSALQTEEGRNEFLKGMNENREEAIRGQPPENQQMVADVLDGIEDAVRGMGEDPSLAKRLAMLHWGELALKTLLLLGSVLLMARVALGRTLAILSCVGWIALNVAWAYSALEIFPTQEARAGVTLVTAISLLWPILALLILMFSKGVRRAVAPPAHY